MADRSRRPSITALGIAYTVLAVAALSRSAYQSTAVSTADRALVAVGLSAVAGVVYLLAAFGLRRGTAASLRMSRWCLVTELAGVLTVSAVELAVGGFGRATVWSGLGVGYGYAPLILPVLGLWLLGHRGRPRHADVASGEASTTCV